MKTQNIKYKVNGEVKILQFEHCKECAYLKSCYSSPAKGPMFLEPSCAVGPVKNSN